MASSTMTVKLDVNIPWLTADERNCIVANLLYQRRCWINAYHDAIGEGVHDRADEYLDHVLDFDRMISKVEAMCDAR